MANTIGSKVVRNLAALFDGVASPTSKRREAESADATSSRGQPCPFGQKESEWLKRVLERQSLLLAGEFDERLAKVEDYQGQLDRRVSALESQMIVDESMDGEKAKVTALQAAVEKMEARTKELEESMKSRHAESEASEHLPHGARSVGPSTSRATDDPLRSLAVMGCLGWDVPEKELVQIACKALKDAGINEDSYSCVAPLCRRGGRGSLVEMRFKDRASLDEARIKMRTKNVQMPQARHPVWIDVKKSEAERRPTRMVRMARATIEEELHRLKRSAEGVEENIRTRSVNIAKCKVGYLDRDLVWWWTTLGEETLPDAGSRRIVESAVAAVP